MHAPGQLGQPLEVVVGLGVDVDDQAAAPLGLKRQQLGGDRLARPQRAGQQHRRWPARPRRLGDVELHRPQPAAHRAADAARRARCPPVRADRHQRAELLDRQHVGVVAHRPAVGARQVIEKQRRLQPERPVQRHRAEAVRAAPRRGARAPRATARRPPARSPCSAAAGARGTAGRRRARAPAAGSPRRETTAARARRSAARRTRCRHRRSAGAHARPHRGCRPSARAPRSRPGTPRASSGVNSSSAVPGNSDSSGSAPSAEHRLKRPALRRVNDQRTVLLEDRRVEMADHVGLQRLIGRPPVRRLDHQRARLPMLVEHRLADAAAGSATQQPLHLAGRRAAHRQRPGARANARSSAATSASISDAGIGGAAATPSSSSTRRRARSAPRSSPAPSCDERSAPARPPGRPRARTSAACADAPHGPPGRTATPPAPDGARQASPCACST